MEFPAELNSWQACTTRADIAPSAAAVVAWVCGSPLTRPGGGGFLLVHAARAGRTHLFDFFVAVPERPAAPEELVELAVDFGGAEQSFHTGAASVAVPGERSTVTPAMSFS